MIYVLCAALAFCALLTFVAVIICVRGGDPVEADVDDGALEGDLRAYVGKLNRGQG